ncbi:hypothetical protein NDU88_004077 [Pleurodeles waltl]|uniref:Uncharacterized protein n=1 Tax=Pleurodeles waltl TaxID=8319 RepID=A0AAV7SHR8_PLEWA|nr:hypothetical protein NDU88_004077 [Pleurodeles waltl]
MSVENRRGGKKEEEDEVVEEPGLSLKTEEDKEVAGQRAEHRGVSGRPSQGSCHASREAWHYQDAKVKRSTQRGQQDREKRERKKEKKLIITDIEKRKKIESKTCVRQKNKEKKR